MKTGPVEEEERIEVTPEEGPRGKTFLARFGLPLAIAVVVLAAAGYFLFGRGKSGKVAVVEPSVTESAPAREPPAFGEVYQISDLIINPADGRRHCMVSVGLEYYNAEKTPDIQRREPLLRDNLITFFSSQPIEVLTNIRYRQAIRSRVKKIVDYQLGEGVVTRVFFEKWVFQ
jgi:flagellar basal body-associated protein FliL